MFGLSKSEQWRIAAACMKYTAKSMRRHSEQFRDAYVVARLNAERPTAPWEYPWVEVVRSQRNRKR